MPITETTTSFDNLGISEQTLRILSSNGFTVPTPIQQQAIPLAIEGKDVLGIAQTGTGKTLAFGIPMIERLLGESNAALILAPTRELAIQIEETLQRVCRPFGLRTALLIGGASMGKQISSLRRRPSILIATPGRLMDHLAQRTLSLEPTQIVVLDEADRMLDMGFEPSIRKIFAEIPAERQTLLFSATMPREILTLAQSFMKDPVRVEVAVQGSTAERVTQEITVVEHDQKAELLKTLLEADADQTVLVFSRTRHGAHKIARNLRVMGFTAAELHSDRTLAQRKAALEGFKNGEYRVLVATDIAARGIDVKNIGLVVNYDLPDNPEDYVHRIGRTGRAGTSGKAITFAMPNQGRDVHAIEKLIRQEIPRTAGSPAEFGRPQPQQSRGRQSGRRPFGGGAKFSPRSGGGAPFSRGQQRSGAAR